MAIATWKSKQFQISNEEVQAIKSISITDAYNDSFNEDGKRVGFEPVTLSLTTDIVSAVLSGDKTAREELDSWRSLVGQESYFYLNGRKLISLPFKLLNVSSSNFVLGNSGELLSVSVQLEFKQAQTAAQAKAAAKAAKSGAAGSGSSSSKSVVAVTTSDNSAWGKYDGGQMTWPVPSMKTISSDYGPRNSPFYGREVHSGIDIPAPIGTSIVASAPGTVILASDNGGYGKCVIVDHGLNIYTLYGHMNSIIVKKGQAVSVGQKIGSVGNTGTSTEPHMHFEVRSGGNSSDKHTNPWNYLSR